MERIEHARNEPDNSQQEEELVNCLLEIVRSTRTCLNNDVFFHPQQVQIL